MKPILKPLDLELFDQLFQFEKENRNWFEQWVPPRSNDYWDQQCFQHSCRKLIAEMDARQGLYCVGILADQIVGRFNLTFTNRNTADVGYRVGRRHLGRGLAKKLSRKLLQLGKEQGIQTFTADALEENLASVAILQSLGFTKTDKPATPVVVQNHQYHLNHWVLSP